MNDEISSISSIKTFEHEKFGQIRYVNVIYRDAKRENETWFAAVDLCRVLDLADVTSALRSFDDDEKMTLSIKRSQTSENEKMTPHNERSQKMTLSITEGHSGKRGGAQFMNFVNEPGMYRLIFMSRKPEAKKFKRLVFHEVLPSIRKYGYYIAPQQELICIRGEKNFRAFKAKYPAGAVEVKKIILEKGKNYYVVLHIAEETTDAH